MFHVKHFPVETIVAIATPVGVGGVGVVRASGKQSLKILQKLFRPNVRGKVQSHLMRLGWIVDPRTEKMIDQVFACYYKAPNSYTGEDVVEIFAHGNPALLENILSIFLSQGARLAERGEFAKKAFLMRKIDLVQAESIIDLVQAKTAKSAGYAVQQLSGKLSRVVKNLRGELLQFVCQLEGAIDFADDLPAPKSSQLKRSIGKLLREVEALLAGAERSRLYRNGAAVAIVGRPNVGKSSLLNALLGESRAIVASTPGTTRDSIEELIDVQGLPIKLIDTAGIREAGSAVEKLGVHRSFHEIASADLVLLLIDSSKTITAEDLRIFNELVGRNVLVVQNKNDLKTAKVTNKLQYLLKGRQKVAISAKTGVGIDNLKNLLVKRLIGREVDSSYSINERHKYCLLRAREALVSAEAGVKAKAPLDCLALNLKSAIIALGEISGEQVSQEVIDEIFNRFCVGK